MNRALRIGLACLLVTLTTGCPDEARNPDLPGGGGGGGGTGGGGGPLGPDASDGAPGQVMFAGRVCTVSDFRTPELCPPGDLTGTPVVEVGTGRMTTVGPDGRFTLTVADRDAVLRVGDGVPGLAPTLVPVSYRLAGEPIVPVANLAGLTNLRNALGVIGTDGAATVAIYPQRIVGAVSGVELIGAPPGTIYPPFYDGGGQLQWNTNVTTGVDGAILMFGVPVLDPTADFTLSPPTGVDVVVGGVPVVPDLVTFVTAAP